MRNFLLALILLVSLAACQPAVSTPALTPVAIQLKWTHQAQFAGYYAADQLGYYAAEGLKIHFIEGGPTVDLTQAVLDGSAQFGITTPEQLIGARAQGQPLRAVAVIFRQSPLAYLALASSGITRPQDFVGKTIQTGASGQVNLHAMMSRLGVSPGQYHEVNLSSDLAPFYSGQVQVWMGRVNNELLTIQAAGYKVNTIFPDDYGIHFYSDTLFTRDDFIASQPDVVLRFVRATLKGWQYAVENPPQAAALTAKYNPKADLSHETEQMTASLPLINTGEDHIGWMKPEVWASMEQTLRQQGVLTAPLDVTQVYTMQFLEEIYP